MADMTKKEVHNDLGKVNIEGDYTGGDKITLTDSAVQEMRKNTIVESFSLNAREYISRVAAKIAEGKDAPNKDWGLQHTDLKEKFDNLKCNPTYIKNFVSASQFFNVIDEIKSSDAVDGGESTIRHIESLITNLYLHFFDDYPNGYKIHNAILNELLEAEGFSQEQYYASDTLIFYTIRECGMFNESK
jgi:hypothetical protein